MWTWKPVRLCIGHLESIHAECRGRAGLTQVLACKALP